MSFSTAMTGDIFADSIVALLAIENARFLGMVRPGDTLRTEVEVLQKRDTAKPDQGALYPPTVCLVNLLPPGTANRST